MSKGGSDPSASWSLPEPPGGYQTRLPLDQEAQFQMWRLVNGVPYDPSTKADYDMRGFWQGLTQGDEQAVTAINQNDGLMHFPDKWKTPYHQSFSNQSMWATPNAPSWNDKDQLVLKDGTVVFDERKQK